MVGQDCRVVSGMALGFPSLQRTSSSSDVRATLLQDSISVQLMQGGGVRGSGRPRHLYISVVRGGVLLAAACRARFRGAPQAPHPHQPRPESNVGPRPNQMIFKCRRRELNSARKGSDNGHWSPANPVQRCHRADDDPLSSSAKDGKVVVQERTKRSEQHAQVSGWYSTKHGT